jgi:oxalate decarboxylase/phosphoglucose isomerase-like protein (cupin superfamily)
MTQWSDYEVHFSEVEPAPIERADGWANMEIRWLVSKQNMGVTEACFWRAVLAPGGAHEKHLHPNAAEVLYVIRGRGASRRRESRRGS